EGLLRGGDNGPVVVPHKARASRLYRFIARLDEPHMPPKQPPLPADQVARVASWIDLGAPYDRPLLDRAGAAAKQPMTVTAEDRLFWPCRPPPRPALPKVKDPAWCRTPVDRFILAKLEEKGLAPEREVGRRKLIRRAYFDLVGLPPPPEEVEAFVHDRS